MLAGWGSLVARKASRGRSGAISGSGGTGVAQERDRAVWTPERGFWRPGARVPARAPDLGAAGGGG